MGSRVTSAKFAASYAVLDLWSGKWQTDEQTEDGHQCLRPHPIWARHNNGLVILLRWSSGAPSEQHDTRPVQMCYRVLSQTVTYSSFLLYSRFLTSFLCVSILLHPPSVWLQHRPIAIIVCQTLCIWILLLPLLGLPVILPSIISCKRPSCLQMWPIHRSLLCQTEFSICLLGKENIDGSAMFWVTAYKYNQGPKLVTGDPSRQWGAQISTNWSKSHNILTLKCDAYPSKLFELSCIYMNEGTYLVFAEFGRFRSISISTKREFIEK